MRSAGQCWFNPIKDGGNHLDYYGPHEPRKDLPPLNISTTEIAYTGFGPIAMSPRRVVFVCKHCACLYWPHVAE